MDLGCFGMTDAQLQPAGRMVLSAGLASTGQLVAGHCIADRVLTGFVESVLPMRSYRNTKETNRLWEANTSSAASRLASWD
jgi:hypothetical protein